MKRLQLLLSVLTVLLVVAALAAGWGWWELRGSLPQLDGERSVAGLGAPVKIERDALGVPTITGATRADVARATGFLHAQDRFFQMDLMRRSAAGELAALFGPVALPVDRTHRMHGFRALAKKVVAATTPDQRAVLDAYVAGVNAGLAALGKKPWEYFVTRTNPQPWRAEDSVLVGYAMWLDLQDTTGALEKNLLSLRVTLGRAGLDFFAPLGDSWDAALDGSTIPPAPLPAFRFKPEATPPAAQLEHLEPRLLPGSNSLAVSGAHTATGAAMLANDMHLNLMVPITWYRAVLRWTDAAGGGQRVVGLTLPGLPIVIVGSNGHVAWGATNAYVDTTDVVVIESDPTAQTFYRTPHGLVEFEDRSDPIQVKGEEPDPFTSRWTEWGPVIGSDPDGRLLALRWNAHDPASTNFNSLGFETATTVAAAVEIAHRAGNPNQNLLVADADGAIAWTLTGTIPRRHGFDGRQPVSWAYGDRRWDGWLTPAEIPAIVNPPAGFLWTANQRPLGGAALALLGDSGYDDGARAGQIRDDLRELVAKGKPVVPTDLLAIELDDRALFLARWQKFLVTVLTDDAVANNHPRGEMREWTQRWDGHASIDSVAYRLVRAFRLKVAERVLEPFFSKARADNPQFSFIKFHYEDAVWRLVQEKPAGLLNPGFTSWDALLLDAVDAVMADQEKSGLPVARFTWGQRNTLRMQHPFGRMLPAFLAQLIDMPAQPLPGDTHLPRVQGPDFGASERLVVSPGHEDQGILHLPGGQSGHPLSPFYRAGHDAWVKGEPTPLLPGPVQHTLVLKPE